MSKRVKRSNEALIQASLDLRFEWGMFEQSVKRLALNNDPESDAVLFNAFLTAFTVYARNLLDFFYPPSNLRPDDIVAGDYFVDFSDWAEYCPPLKDELDKVRTKV